MRLIDGAVVVFEGLDKTGKSTQVEALSTLPWSRAPFHTHMPSGTSEATQKMYRALEERKLQSSLAQQLFHLACHAENVPQLAELASTGGLLLDRWWWSTVAYGWFAGGLSQSAVSRSTFDALTQAIWRPISASVHFLFLETYAHDDINRSSVREGYLSLAEQYSETTVVVPRDEPLAVTQFLRNELETRKILVP